MDQDIIRGADAVALFCRIQMNTKKNLPIRSSEMGVLFYTHTEDEPVTPLRISEYFKITKPAVTVMVNVLVKKGYLIKVPSSVDRRSYAVLTTDKGDQLVGAAYKEYFKSMELLNRQMGSKEFLQLISLIERANKLLSEVNEK
ncbi:MarR family winged helix-turn-helix transcriptional regulator [Desemzia incerta]|uniref:MarR family winged helix-turn-helix transcriptional regulator n=1 Tax=Desemzia incerta TaxID=82801 RepID=UPI003CFCC207